MQEEHFGISVVEMLCAGLLVIAHNSGGVKDDILKNEKNVTFGHLSEDSEFVKNLSHGYMDLFGTSDTNRLKAREMIQEGRNRLRDKVSNDSFSTKFYNHVKSLL